MAVSRGKQFEELVKRDFNKIPGAFVYRLQDQVSGFKTTSQNVSDFICYVKPNIFLLEVKTIKGNTFPITNFTQLPKLQHYEGISGLKRGVLIWYIDHFRILYVPVITIEQLLKDNKKSVNIRTIDKEGYNYIEIPAVKKRLFLDADYSILCDLPENW